MNVERTIAFGLNLLVVIVCAGWAACEFGWDSGVALLISVGALLGLAIPILKGRETDPDVPLFQQLMEDLPPPFVQQSMKHRDLGGAVPASFLDTLGTFSRSWKDVRHEFRSEFLEERKHSLLSSIDALLDELTGQVFGVGCSDSYQIPKPDSDADFHRWKSAIDRLHSLLDSAVADYEQLIRDGRKRLRQ
jgi:hypothetical protein